MPPPKPKSSAAIAPIKGTKKTFDDDDDFEMDFQAESSSSKRQVPQPASDDGDEDESDDDMPEAVGMGAGKSQALKDLESAQELLRSKKAAEKARNQKIAALKAKEASKNKAVKPPIKSKKISEESEDEESDGDDEETRRLKARMRKAMDAGDGDSNSESFHTDSEGEGEEGEEDGSSDEELDEFDGQSFHTDSEDDEEEEDDEEDDDEDDDEDYDDSEILEEGPIDAATKAMRDRMQAAMEAAERRSGIVHPSKPKQTVESKDTPKSKTTKRKAEVEVDDESMWDLGSGTGEGGPQPLSMEVLKKAEEEEREAKRRKKEKQDLEDEKKKAAEKGGEKKRKRKVKEQPTRRVGGKTVQMLQPTLDPTSGGLPPMLDAGSKLRGQAAGQASKKRFVKSAMKSSGNIPGKGRVDGRRNPTGLEARS